mgnify:CR=1 FL=1
MPKELAKQYAPQGTEDRIYQNWCDKGYFHTQIDRSKKPFTIVMPPPNVTGSLHMGHAFQQTIMDTMIRYQRMQGKNTLWQVGTDHAGIATQMVVERKIAAEEGKTRHDYGREAFIDKIWEWKAESGGTITRQMRRLGNSVDWERERFTMDEGLSNAVKEVFVRLYKRRPDLPWQTPGKLGPETAHRYLRPGSGKPRIERFDVAHPLSAG